jgi:DNA mismatch repair protein MutL
LIEDATMPRILPLDPLVVGKIAAGEVIERPASVLKELLENSVDAGARRIDVEVEQGGIERIALIDDGCGIEPDDLTLALTNHATSKIREAEELFEIASLGFRGEALASIASVSQLTLQSRPTGRESGAELRCHGGQMSPCRPWNGAPGTRIEVRHLFFNTPVRRKFLRAAPTEFGHISEAFTRLALASGEFTGPSAEVSCGLKRSLHLTLKHNGKSSYDIPATATLFDRIGSFYGPEVQSALYAVEHTEGPARIFGYIADPSCERGTARMQYLFLNGRWIRDRSLAHAIQEAYRGLLMVGRYAVCFLFVELPPDRVDVNVHPTKSEVRFREPEAVHHLVFKGVRNRLHQANLTARLHLPPTPVGETTNPIQPHPLEGRPPLKLTSPLPRFAELPFTAPRMPVPQPQQPAQRLPTPTPVVPVPEPALEPVPTPAVPTPSSPLTSGTAVTAATLNLAPQRVLQLYDTYLVLETAEGMLVIDQHALHERILFEQLKRRIREGTIPTQKLLIPEPVDLTAEQAARVLEQRDDLAHLGLLVEPFGGRTVLVSGYPTMLGKRGPGELLKAVVDHLTTRDRLPTREVLFNDLLSLMACHSAVRAGDRLPPEEMESLLALRYLVDDSHHCPHGRPTALLFSRQELERQFGRI